ncbi:hypothetical protein KR067_006842 [Drosophila pandora]|nr:hypothetical protein KR067_006842 [Drosophila pandora]
MCSRLTGNVLTRFCGPSSRYVGLAVRPVTVLVKYQLRHCSEPSLEMSGAVFKRQLAESLREKKAAKQRREAQRDAIRMKDMLYSCIEQRTKVLRASIESMSKDEQAAMGGLMNCVMVGIRSVCIRRVLMKFCKEQMMKRRYAQLIKEKKIRCIMQQCAQDEHFLAEEELQKKEAPGANLEVASLKENKVETDCQVCEVAEEMKTYLKTAAEILERELYKDLKPQPGNLEEKCEAKEAEEKIPEESTQKQDKDRPPENNCSPPRSKYEEKLKECFESEWKDICQAQKYLSSKEKKQFQSMVSFIEDIIKKSCRKKVIKEMCEEAWGVQEEKKDEKQHKKEDGKKEKQKIRKLWCKTNPEARLRQRVQDRWNEVCPYIKELTKEDNVDFGETAEDVKKMIRESCLKEQQVESQEMQLKDVTIIARKCAIKALKKKCKEFNESLKKGPGLKQNEENEKLRKQCAGIIMNSSQILQEESAGVNPKLSIKEGKLLKKVAEARQKLHPRESRKKKEKKIQQERRENYQSAIKNENANLLMKDADVIRKEEEEHQNLILKEPGRREEENVQQERREKNQSDTKVIKIEEEEHQKLIQGEPRRREEKKVQQEHEKQKAEIKMTGKDQNLMFKCDMRKAGQVEMEKENTNLQMKDQEIVKKEEEEHQKLILKEPCRRDEEKECDMKKREQLKMKKESSNLHMEDHELIKKEEAEHQKFTLKESRRRGEEKECEMKQGQIEVEKENENFQMEDQEPIKNEEEEHPTEAPEEHEEQRRKEKDNQKELEELMIRTKVQNMQKLNENDFKEFAKEELKSINSNFYKILRENYNGNPLNEKKTEKIGLRVRCQKLDLQEKGQALQAKPSNIRNSPLRIPAMHICNKFKKKSEGDGFTNKKQKTKHKKTEEKRSEDSKEKEDQNRKGLKVKKTKNKNKGLKKGSEDSPNKVTLAKCKGSGKQENKKDTAAKDCKSSKKDKSKGKKKSKECQEREIFELRELSEEVALEEICEKAACGESKPKVKSFKDLCKKNTKNKPDEAAKKKDKGKDSKEKQAKNKKKKEEPKCPEDEEQKRVCSHNLKELSEELSLEERCKEASCKKKGNAVQEQPGNVKSTKDICKKFQKTEKKETKDGKCKEKTKPTDTVMQDKSEDPESWKESFKEDIKICQEMGTLQGGDIAGISSNTIGDSTDAGYSSGQPKAALETFSNMGDFEQSILQSINFKTDQGKSCTLCQIDDGDSTRLMLIESQGSGGNSEVTEYVLGSIKDTGADELSLKCAELNKKLSNLKKLFEKPSIKTEKNSKARICKKKDQDKKDQD